MLIETTAQKNFNGPRTLRNEGTIIYSGAGLYHGSNPLLENVGTFDITGDGAIDGPTAAAPNGRRPTPVPSSSRAARARPRWRSC